jgi:hypothetical protein
MAERMSKGVDGRGERVSKEADTPSRIPTAAKFGIAGGKDSIGSVQEGRGTRWCERMRGGTAMGTGGGSGPVWTRGKSIPARGF